MEQGYYSLIFSLFTITFSIIPSAIWAYSLSWPLSTLWFVFCGWRWYFADRKLLLDCITLGALSIIVSRDIIKYGLAQVCTSKFASSIQFWSILVATLISAVVAIETSSRFGHGPTESPVSQEHEKERATKDSKLSVPSSMVFPCRTTHARTFPTKHKFGYSYLLLGVPITKSLIKRDHKWVEQPNDKEIGTWWMKIRAEDYLDRGFGEEGFCAKLTTFLNKEVRRRTFVVQGDVWLITIGCG